MNVKKHLILIVGCGLALVLALASVVLLIRSMGSYGREQSELKSKMARLDQLNRRKPFPSDENIAQTRTNVALIQKVLMDTQAHLRTGQVESEEIESAQFGPLLEKTVKQLKNAAKNHNVMLPERFAFGFDRYSAGDLPMSNAIPRLVTQLKTVAALCDVLYAAKVTNIVSISRDEFESTTSKEGSVRPSSAAPSIFAHQTSERTAHAGLRDIPVAASNELFSAERFSMEFSGRENSVWEVLNALVSGPTFVVIRDLTLESATTGLRTSGGSGERPFAAPVYSERPSEMGLGYSAELVRPGMPPAGLSTNLIAVPREDRVVAGREFVRVTIVLDAYRFALGKGETK
jgi:hypothetical protein